MPIFDFICSACGHEFEELVTRPTDPVTCARCGQPAEKQLSVFASPSGSGGGDTSCACYPTGGG